MGRFYVLSNGGAGRLELAEELAGDVALEATLDFADALALLDAPLHVLLSFGVLAHADHDDGVECAVELAVTEAVQAVPDDGSRRCLDRCHARELGEGRFGTHAAGMRPRHDELRGDD